LERSEETSAVVGVQQYKSMSRLCHDQYARDAGLNLPTPTQNGRDRKTGLLQEDLTLKEDKRIYFPQAK
jgi:hypothetical protein